MGLGFHYGRFPVVEYPPFTSGRNYSGLNHGTECASQIRTPSLPETPKMTSSTLVAPIGNAFCTRSPSRVIVILYTNSSEPHMKETLCGYTITTNPENYTADFEALTKSLCQACLVKGLAVLSWAAGAEGALPDSFKFRV